MSKVEKFKQASRHLRGTIESGLVDATDHFDSADIQLLKFHGLYQQDDRDARRLRGAEKRHTFMVRTKVPGGRLTADQYLAHDALSREYADGTLRITTRQCIQLHGLLKGDLSTTIRALDHELITTLGACGDVVRNVMCCPLPDGSPLRAEATAQVTRLTERFMPHTRAYHEIWLDGERLSEESLDDEPLYGATYLPRKFKIAIAHPGDNCVDVATQDVGILVVADRDALMGFNLLVGGGLGMTHTKSETFPRLGDPFAFVGPDELVDVVEQIVAVQRDHGDRVNRRHARLKYLIHDRGIGWFRREVAARLGRALPEPLLVNPGPRLLHHGWQRQSDTQWVRGVFVESGRIKDDGPHRTMTALRTIVERFRVGVVLTANQDLLLTEIDSRQREAIDAVLVEHGVPDGEALTPVRAHAMACPALPTCGLALAEAERELPAIIDELELELRRLGLEREALSMRITGCPNGCARPYVAELGFVGRSLGRYLVLIGGAFDGRRLNETYADLVPRNELIATVRPLLELFVARRRTRERFGAFCRRLGVERLRELTDVGSVSTAVDQRPGASHG